MHNQSKEGDVWEERSRSLLSEKRDVLKRDSKEFWKKNEEVREWGRDWQLKEWWLHFFFFWAITLEIYKVQGACIIRSLPGASILKGIEGKYW